MNDVLDNVMSWFGGIFCAGIYLLWRYGMRRRAIALGAFTLLFALATLYMISQSV